MIAGRDALNKKAAKGGEAENGYRSIGCAIGSAT